MSNWEKRPLRESQVHYGALDAWVLVLLVEKMRENDPEAFCPSRKIVEIEKPNGKQDLHTILDQIFKEILEEEKHNWEARGSRFENSMRAKQEKKADREAKSKGTNENVVKEKKKN